MLFLKQCRQFGGFQETKLIFVSKRADLSHTSVDIEKMMRLDLFMRLFAAGWVGD